MKNRDITIDMVKILCLFYIVFFNHLSNYGNVYTSKYYLSDEITASSLLTLMFFGSFFFSKKELSCRNILAFYKRRFSRFYILYFMSIISLIAGGLFVGKNWFYDNTQIYLSFLGLSAFYKPELPTLWFMSMLMFFYIITPFLQSKNLKFNLVSTILLFSIILFFHIIDSLLVDDKILIFLLVYTIGLKLPKNVYKKVKKNRLVCFFIGFFVFLTLANIKTSELVSIIQILYAIGFIVMLISACDILLDKIHINKFIRLLSYTQLCVYLFHRQIYLIIINVLKLLNIEVTTYILLFVFLPVCVIISFCIQALYDISLQKLEYYKKTKSS